MCSSISSKPMRSARLAAETKASRTRSMSASVTSRGVCQPSPNGQRRSGDGRPRILPRARARRRLPTAAAPRPCGRHARSGCRTWRCRRGAPRDDARERRLVVVGVEAEAAVGDAAVALDMGRLDDHQRGAGIAPACRDASDASRWRSRRRPNTGTSARRRCGWQARGRPVDRARKAHCSWDWELWKAGFSAAGWTSDRQ